MDLSNLNVFWIAWWKNEAKPNWSYNKMRQNFISFPVFYAYPIVVHHSVVFHRSVLVAIIYLFICLFPLCHFYIGCMRWPETVCAACCIYTFNLIIIDTHILSPPADCVVVFISSWVSANDWDFRGFTTVPPHSRSFFFCQPRDCFIFILNN